MTATETRRGRAHTDRDDRHTGPMAEVPTHQVEPQFMSRPCGFCAGVRGANPAPHSGCPGVITNGNGIVLHCPCGCRAIHCRSCMDSTVDEIDPVRWRCIDQAACAIRVADKRAAVRAELLGPQYNPKEPRMTEPTFTDDGRKKESKPKRESRAKVGECQCGCVGTTKGGRFLPGHDARLKSGLANTLRQSDRRPERSLALAELLARDWATNKVMIDVPVGIQDEARSLIKRVGGAAELIRKATLARNKAFAQGQERPDTSEVGP